MTAATMIRQSEQRNQKPMVNQNEAGSLSLLNVNSMYRAKPDCMARKGMPNVTTPRHKKRTTHSQFIFQFISVPNRGAHQLWLEPSRRSLRRPAKCW